MRFYRPLIVASVLLASVIVLWASLPASDAFTDSNGTALTAHSAGGITWVNNNGVFQINTNAAVSNSINADTMVHDATNTYNADHWSSVVLAGTISADNHGPTVRVATSAHTGYVYYAWTGRRDLYQIIAGSFTLLDSDTTSPVMGQTFRIEIVGTSITCKVDGSTTVTKTDTGITTGSAGIAGYNNATGFRLDDFAADNIGGAPPPSRRRVLIMSAEAFLNFWKLPVVQAQTTNRFYLMPVTGTGSSHLDPIRPKYANTDIAGLSWGMLPYGEENLALVHVRDIPIAIHTALAAELDVIAIPQDIDATVGAGALTTVRNALENRNIPGQWVGSGSTYREVLRLIARTMLCFQRLQGLRLARLFQSGVTLDTQFNQLPAGVRTNLIAMADSMNLDRSSLSGTSTIRTMLKALADQWTTTVQLGNASGAL